METPTGLPDLRIGSLRINPPIIQGGMGVRVSASRLASAVSNEGALGVVASVGTGEEWPDRSLSYADRSSVSLRDMLRKTAQGTDNPFAVNVMCALSNYAELVRVAVEEGAGAIISGAGLPMKLPELVPGGETALVPVVSSARAAELVCRTWARKFKRVPDALIVEGTLAGGHLGFSDEELAGPAIALETLVSDVLEVARKHTTRNGGPIPVVAAGGVFDGRDIARMISLGAAGVQMGTRFVCTRECDASDAYKQAYVNCREEDIIIVRSPVGLPLRVIRNAFVDRVHKGEREPFRCAFHCLSTCDPVHSPYCVAAALVNAYRGNLDAGFVTCGANAYRIDRIVSVRELISELVAEAVESMEAPVHPNPPSVE